MLNQHNSMIWHQHQYLVNILFYKAPLIDMQDSVAINILQPHWTFICSLTQGYLTDLLMEYILTESVRSELLI